MARGDAGQRRLLEDLRHLQELGDMPADVDFRKCAADLREVERQELQGDELRREGLG